LNSFIGHWKGPDQPLVIRLAFLIGGCWWLRSVDAVVDRQPHSHNPIADAIERSPSQPPHRFEYWVPYFADNLGFA
jgi:hypothetical protein